MSGNTIKLDQEVQSDNSDALHERLTLETFKERIRHCGDVLERHVVLGNESEQGKVALYYCDGLVDSSMFHMNLIPMLENWTIEHQSRIRDQEEGGTNREENHADSQLGNSFLHLDADKSEHIFARLFSGSVILVFSNVQGFYEYNIANQPARKPEESTMELSLKGPRDGFIEQLSVNVALVRRRMRSPNLHVEYYKLGTDTQTEVVLMHMHDQARPELVEEARRRLRGIHVPSLNGAGELEERLADQPAALFPLIDYVGRPDYVVQSVMKGRIAILVDGSPAALIAPGNLSLLVKSPEDAHLPYYFVTLERILRILGLMLALFLPGFWIALCSYNTDQIPFNLLATITISRIGLPLSATMEMMMMMVLFEVFREAGVRLPRPVGQTVSVVGGLIIGEAAIEAGLTSPTMLVVAAVAAVATFTLVNQSLVGAVSLFRFVILLCSSIFGMYGFFVSMFGLLIYLCSLESFGMSYMEPLAPLRPKDIVAALMQKPWIKHTSRRRKP